MQKYFVFNLFLFFVLFGFNAEASKITKIRLALEIKPANFSIEYNSSLSEIKINNPNTESIWSVNLESDNNLKIDSLNKKNFYLINGSLPSEFEIGDCGIIGEKNKSLNLITSLGRSVSGQYILNNLKISNTENSTVYLTLN